VELTGAAQIEEMATQLVEDLEFNSQAAEQASLLTVVLACSFLMSAVLTCFCDSFVSLDGTKGS
jgi:hypothetical protein